MRPRRDPASATLAAGISLLAAILGLILLAWLVLFVTKGRFLKPTFERVASRMAERRVAVAGDFQFYFAPFDAKFLAEGLTVSNPAWASKPNFFAADRIDARFATLKLLFGERRFNWLELANGAIDAEWDASGKRNTWTFGDPNAPAKPFELPDIRQAIVSGTTLRYRDPRLELLADVRFDTVRGALAKNKGRIDDAIRFSGGGSVRGERFTLSGAQTSPNELLSGGRNQFELHARAVSTQLDVSGTLPGATVIEGADLKVALRGRNVADVARLAGFTTPDTRAYRLRSNLTKRGLEWRFTRLTGQYGSSDIAGALTYSMPENRPTINADLQSRVVDIVDLGPFIGYDPNALATKSVTAAVKQTGGAPRLLPDAPLRTEAIAGFDAHVDYAVKDIRNRNLPISNVQLTLDLKRSRLALSPLTFDMARGHLASDIIIDARQRPVFTDYDIRLSPTPMGRLLAGWGVEEAGTSGTIKARIKMTGRGDTVRDSLGSSNGRIAIILPKGTFWTRNIQLAELDVGTFVQKMFEKRLKEPVQINCGLIGFTVRNGVAVADPILIDTSKNVMLGRGQFSFRDESIDLAFRADSKKFSLFAGQSPVGINGHFAAPGFSVISPELIGRGAAGVGLAVAASPLAAVLAFVDVGDAKGAACGPVLAGASAQAQRTTKGKPRDDVGSGKAKQEKKKG